MWNEKELWMAAQVRMSDNAFVDEKLKICKESMSYDREGGTVEKSLNIDLD